MLRYRTAAILLIAGSIGGAAPASLQPPPVAERVSAEFDSYPAVSLRRFASEAEFEAYLEELRELRRARAAAASQAASEAASQDAAEAAEPAGVVSDEEFTLSGATNVEQAINTLPQVVPGSTGFDNREITNNQSVGVDEGGIVKQIGRYLIVLQDGRLFSADLGSSVGAPLRLAGRIDVYSSRDTAASWYDEMLVIGNRILVTAYSYEHDASEISVFTLDQGGRFTREGRWLLSSDDYYSTENYATRLVGNNLVFYAPIGSWRLQGEFRWPRLRRAPRGGSPDEGERLIGPTEIYAPVGQPDFPVIHTLSICPIREGIECRTTAFVGAAVRELYVSPTDAFLWLDASDGLPWSIEYANERRRDCKAEEIFEPRANQAALLYRVPLDGSEVGAVAVDGVPENQFAFDSRGGRFRALLSKSDGNCRKPEGSGPLVLLDIPLSAFGRDVRRIAASAYTSVPSIEEGSLENRFVGDWLIYGGRTRWSRLDEGESEARPTASTLWTVPLARPEAPVGIGLPHNALRIERAGMDAVVTGYRGEDGLSLSYVTLGAAPRLASTALLPGRVESEGRSHAFGAWIRPDGSGLIGLPTSRRGRAGRGWSDSESSNLSYVAVSPAKSLSPAGELRPGPRDARSGYRCVVSCIDWYGNSRPIFTGGRIFALMGTDLVEGRMVLGRVAEAGRVDLTGEVSAR